MTLVCKDLVVEYSSGDYVVRPIDGLDMEVSNGELVLLLGASGCGKTTLLSVLAAILRPRDGSVRLDDLEVTELRGIALVEEDLPRDELYFGHRATLAGSGAQLRDAVSQWHHPLVMRRHHDHSALIRNLA